MLNKNVEEQTNTIELLKRDVRKRNLVIKEVADKQERDKRKGVSNGGQ